MEPLVTVPVCHMSLSDKEDSPRLYSVLPQLECEHLDLDGVFLGQLVLLEAPKTLVVIRYLSAVQPKPGPATSMHVFLA